MSHVSLRVASGIAQITLENEAKLNALTVGMLDQLAAHLDAIEVNPEVRSVLVTGAGPKAFCCGADISEWGPLSPADFARHWVRKGHRVFDRLARLHLPTLAAVNGHAFGGGFELAAACDMRIMAPRATLALPEARVGIVPGWSGTQRALRLMPEPVVKEMALFGRRISAERAFGLGCVAEVSEDVTASGTSILADLTALSPRATETAKAMIHAAQDEDRAAMIEALGSAAIAASEDRAEGVAAFLNKRPAEFSGR
ncbi:enoyl-CoA hydratase/isomerase family protein [Marivita sp. S6314]|uniref:enoyl-CoA hydratase/isomerase family protein n=1 Tax=Marivita sp. S6314 TaxID=2926406 RepID=UPI001FF466D4|nr:enoyl-CoA hydratase/isomerase family protein [Marivita sp. S6314]MCK0149333.1 enoyl-CoA hydratase/isomerase family protein [Marivita sp. S6314]